MSHTEKHCPYCQCNVMACDPPCGEWACSFHAHLNKDCPSAEGIQYRAKEAQRAARRVDAITEKIGYELPRQLFLLSTINYSVVIATQEQQEELKRLIPQAMTFLWSSPWGDMERVAEGMCLFYQLVSVVGEVGSLPYPQNKWLQVVAEKLCFWFGPEAEIRDTPGAP